MENNLNKKNILQEMKHLLRYSCKESAIENNYFESLHVAILKKHFNAGDVKIDYVSRTIHLSMCVDENPGFFGRKSFVDVEMKFRNIYEFLEDCLEDDNRDLSFYKNILSFYNSRVA